MAILNRFSPVSCLALAFCVALPLETIAIPFLRGDANQSGEIEIADATMTLSHLFLGGEEVTCDDALDTNDDGELGLSDAVLTLFHKFLGDVIPLPFPACGEDPSPDDLECGGSEACPSCFTQDDLDVVIVENSVEAICLVAPVLETVILGNTIVVCPPGTGICTDGRDGCSFIFEEITGTLDVTAAEVVLNVVGEVPSVVVQGGALLGGCDFKVGIDGVAFIPFVLRDLGNGTAEVRLIGDPEIDSLNTDITFSDNETPGLDGLICGIVLGSPDTFKDIIIEELGPQLDEALQGIEDELLGTIVCLE